MLILELSKLIYQTIEYMVYPSDLNPIKFEMYPLWEMRTAREKEQLHQTKGGKSIFAKRPVDLERRLVSTWWPKHKEKWRQGIEGGCLGDHSHFPGESSMGGEPTPLNPTHEHWTGESPFLLEDLTFSIGNSVFSLSFHMSYWLRNRPYFPLWS